MAQTAAINAEFERLDTLWRRANALATEGQAADALPLYQQIVDARPQLPQAQVNLGLMLFSLGRIDEALTRFDTAKEIDPFFVAAYLNAGNAEEMLGRRAQAIANWETATQIDPTSTVAWQNLTDVHLADGAIDKARTAIDQAYKVAPDDAEVCCKRSVVLAATDGTEAALRFLRDAHDDNPDTTIAMILAEALSDLKRHDEAIALAHDIMAAAPNEPHAWNACAGVFMASGDHEQALTCLHRTRDLAPEIPEIRQNLARCYAGMGQLVRALEIQREVIAQLPDSSSMYHDAGMVCFQLGRHDEAETLLRRAVELAPSSPRLWSDLANLLRVGRRHTDARVAAERALALDPDAKLAELTLAYAMADLGEPERALEHSVRALEKARDDVKFIVAVGELYESWKLIAPAMDVYRRALQIEPAQPRVSARLLDLALSACDWSEYDKLVAQQIEAIEGEIDSTSNSFDVDVFNLQALPVSYAFTARAARAAAAAIARAARRGVAAAPFVHRSRRRDKIRVGYALGYTWFHSLPLVLKDVISGHDRDRFEVFGYAVRPCSGDDFSRDYRAAFDRFRDVPITAPHDAATMINNDEVDILIDVTGLTSINCMPISSFRPAPVQMHGYGYSITTGADYIDYLITDRTYIPPEWEALGPEQLIYLPNTFMPTRRREPAEQVPTRAEVGLPDDVVVFCNFNHPCKFEPTTFSLWMRILAAVPDSVLWFGRWMRDTHANLRREAQARGIDPGRLVFANIVQHKDHLARLPLADIALDNLQHGGGITTVDALAAGVPVLTVLGDKPAARLGATLVHAIAMPELVQPDADSYERRAIELAQQPGERQTMRDKLLRQRDTSALFDTGTYQRHLETALTAAWQNHLDGHAPRRIEVLDDGGVSFG